MNWKDITIDKYQRLQEKIAIKDAIKSKRAVLQVLTGIPFEKLDKMLMIDMLEAYNNATEFMLTPMPMDWSKKIIIDGQEFTPAYKMSEWTSGQFMSFQNLAKDGVGSIHVVMAVMLKKGKEYLDEGQIKERAEWLKYNMSIADAYPLYVFFSIVLIKFAQSIQGYSATEEVMERLYSEFDGVGIS